MAASNLVVRVATAAVGGAVLLALLLVVPPPGFFLLVLFACCACAWELHAMAAPADLAPRLLAVASAGAACAAIGLHADRPVVLWTVLVASTIGQGTLHLARSNPIETVGSRFAVSVLATPYAGCLLPFVALLHQPPGGPQWVILVLVAAWLADTGAYFAGRAFGRTPLAPSLSPKKTWEGAIGGVVCAVGAAVLVRYWLLRNELPVSDAIVVGVLGGVLGPVGDLCESTLKRSFGVKDSGKLLPGHGGMLDRVDALLFVAPAAWLWLWVRGVI